MSEYELQRRTGANDVTHEWSYDSSTEAIEQGRRNAESNPGEVWEVVRAVPVEEGAAVEYEVIWSSRV